MGQQDQLSGQINLFHTIFIVCLVIFILMLLFSVFIFIRLNILGVIGFLTGKTQQKAVEKMIAGESFGKSDSSAGRRKKKQDDKKTRKAVADTIMTPSGQLKKPGSDEVMLSTGSDITDVLGEHAKTEERMADGPVVGIQTSNVAEISSDALASRKMTRPMGTFVIEKSIVLVHTDEVIT